ncbi:MAG: hypothetical protein OHK0029_22850 [Armatimonadaceae bacterium]
MTRKTLTLRCFLWLLAGFFLVGTARAQTGTLYTPKPGTKERKAIMDALRVPVQKDLMKKVIFKIDTLNVLGEWAFLRGVPLQPDDKPMNYRGTRYQEAQDEGAFDDSITALLRKMKGKWTVVTFNIGATDVVWETWDKDYKAPRAVFRLPESS